MNIFQKFKAYFKRRMQEIEQEEYDKAFPKLKMDTRKVNVWTNAEMESFKRNLAQVIAWTTQILEGFDHSQEYYGKVLRQTNPILDGVPLYSFREEWVSWTDRDWSQEYYERLLKIAIEGRPSIDAIDFQNISDIGRILSFETDISTYDGAPIVESQFLVDDADVPPIDTWFFLKSNYFHGSRTCKQALFCWIPKVLEPWMEQAMAVEILGSYRWLDENDPEFYQAIIATK